MTTKVIKIKAKGEDDASSVLSNVGNSVKSLGSKAASVAASGLMAFAGGVLAVGTAAGVAAVKLANMTLEAAGVESTRETFIELTAEMGEYEDVIAGVQEATRGMIADTDLWAGSNKLLGMGIAETEEELLTHLEAATQLGTAYGDNESAIENWALMMANQSIPRLDSFGISSADVRERMAELQDETEGLSREQAFNIAVMEEAEVAMEKVGEQGDGVTAMMSRWKATQDNLTNSAGRAFIPVLNAVMGTLNPLVDEYGPILISILEEWGSWLGEVLPPFLEDMQELLGVVGIAFGNLTEALGINTGEMDSMAIFMAIVTTGMNLLTSAVKLIVIALDAARKAAEWFKNMLFEADKVVNNIRYAVERFVGWVERVRDALGSLHIPDWLLGHSPSPLENSIVGITKALKNLPDMDMAFSVPQSISSAGMSAGARGGGYVINNYFNRDSIRSDEDVLAVSNQIAIALQIRGLQPAL